MIEMVASLNIGGYARRALPGELPIRYCAAILTREREMVRKKFRLPFGDHGELFGQYVRYTGVYRVKLSCKQALIGRVLD